VVWYLDTSAFVKLVRDERDSGALTEWTAGRGICSSDLLRTEARRALSAADEAGQARLEWLIEQMWLIRLAPDVFDDAGRLRTHASLRSLDAIHIAAATRLGPDLEGIATYDGRMATAAGELGIAVAAPAQ